MNCKEVQELLPLHVGGDLAAKKSLSVTVHLKSCDACTTLVMGYRESFLLTKNLEPPAFGADFYDGIRQSVLSEIARDSDKTHSWFLPNLLPRAFRLRPEWAVAAVLIVAAFAFYFINNRDGGRVETVQVPTWNPPKPVVPSSSDIAGSAVTSVPPNHGHRRMGNNDRKPRHRKAAVKEPTYAAQLVNGAPGSVAASQRAPASAEPLRVEMQTSDSNIRIIWFTYQNAKQDSPGKGF